jgi:diguanylate cyclase (GGDEF)-like protein
VRKCLDAIGPYDVVARVGGEEFMVLLPGATLDAACEVGERLRSSIANNAFEVGIPPPIKITISIGVSQFGRDGDTLDAFLGVADQRLYRAKHEGRNCVIAA